MAIYSFKNLRAVYVIGDSRENIRFTLHKIKNILHVKDEDMDEDKPSVKEFERRLIERQLRPTLRDRRGGGPAITFDANELLREQQSIKYSDLSNKKRSTKTSLYAGSLFILVGNCGLGINKYEYYKSLFEKMNKILEYNNVHVLMIRGCHDDPSYFDGEMINFSNIKAIPDYSVIEAQNKNILCIGGSISPDRTWRKEQEKRINMFSDKKQKSLYWENEGTVLDVNAIAEIAKTHKIDYVMSPVAPSFIGDNELGSIDSWLIRDKNLKEDINNEKLIIDKIFEALRDNDIKPEYWAYSDNGCCSSIEKRAGIIFRALPNAFTPISTDGDIVAFKALEENNKKKGAVKRRRKLKTVFEDVLQEEQPHPEPEDGDVDFEEEAENIRANDYAIDHEAAGINVPNIFTNGIYQNNLIRPVQIPNHDAIHGVDPAMYFVPAAFDLDDAHRAGNTRNIQGEGNNE